MWAVHSPNDALVAIKHSLDLTDLLDHRKGFAPAEWVTFLVATKWLRFTDVKRALYRNRGYSHENTGRRVGGESF